QSIGNGCDDILARKNPIESLRFVTPPFPNKAAAEEIKACLRCNLRRDAGANALDAMLRRLTDLCDPIIQSPCQRRKEKWRSRWRVDVSKGCFPDMSIGMKEE